MNAIAIVRIIAILSSGIFAGILFGDRMGATFARPSLSPSSFLQFQRIQHVHFARMMPPLTLAAILSGLGWLIIPPENMREIWSRWESVHTIRTILWSGAFALEVIALSLW